MPVISTNREEEGAALQTRRFRRKRILQLHIISSLLTALTLCILLIKEYINGDTRPDLLPVLLLAILISFSGRFTWLLYRERIQHEDNEEKYRQLFNEIAVPLFITDSNGRILDFNKRATVLLGYSREELLKMSFTGLLTEAERTSAPPRFHLVETGNSFISERNFLHKNGSVVNAEINASRLPGNRLMGVVKDITVVKRLQKELEDYKYALDKAAIVTMTDKHGIITYANENFCNISGYSQEKLIGRNNNIVNSGYHPDVFFKSFWHTIRSGKVWSGEIRNRARDGSIFWVYATVVPFLDENGEPYQYAGIRQDITFRKEERMRIDKAILQAQEKERNHIGMELHDNVNQLLSAALLYLSAIDQEGRSANNEEILMRSRDYIHDAVREIRQISHHLAPVTSKELSVHDLYASLLNGLRSIQPFEVSLDIDDKGFEELDPEINRNLYRIVQELLNNIIKYAHAKTVSLSIRVQEEKIRLYMKDDGIGFDPAASQGGIGLENIRRRAQLFGGNVQFISAPGQGCEVRVELPLSENQSMVA